MSVTARNALITGGAGFIGSNLTERLLREPGTQVSILDNLARRGVEHNLDWLRSLPNADRLTIIQGDVRDTAVVKKAVCNVDEIYHLAAQVAVTTSVDDPATDFDVNARGTFNVLEAARSSLKRPFLLYTSTNKVYGSLDSVPVHIDGTRFRASSASFKGIDEQERLDFHSPYGCSKGAADQYVHDYSRIYGLPAVVFRMSCIAGPRQFGNEDQGWVAHFLYSILNRSPITIYGDGFQVRDVLHVYDLVDAMVAARSSAERTVGQVFNLGGGMQRATSVIDLIRRVERMTGNPVDITYRDSRPGDQPLYITNTSKLQGLTGWRPTRSLDETLENLLTFWLENSSTITSYSAASSM